jgi:hypothetical protein
MMMVTMMMITVVVVMVLVVFMVVVVVVVEVVVVCHLCYIVREFFKFLQIKWSGDPPLARPEHLPDMSISLKT